MTASVVILILAAGASSRMGGQDKLLQDVHGEPLLRRQARLASETGCPVLVALPPDRPARQAALAGLAVGQVTVPDPGMGMSASLRAGLQAAGAFAPAGLMILPADMPDFTVAALSALIAAWRKDPSRIWRGQAATGQAGHPAIFPPDLWPALDRTMGDQGGRQVLADHADRVSLLPLPGLMAVTDLDTPEDWADWRARQGQ